MRDKSLTKPSGLTGDTKPYPAKLWEWTAGEFTAFLEQYRYPACTFKDRLASHKQAVIEAIYNGHAVSEEVLADYPTAKEDAEIKTKADEQ